MKTLLAILFVLAVITIVPIAFILALNELFMLYIPITFKTYISSLIVVSVLYGGSK